MTELATTAASVIRPRPVDDPELRLFLLHHAGGSHLAYRDWAPRFPASWDICLLEAPGRGSLSQLPAHVTAPGLSAHFLDAVAPRLDVPFALFGHSMGALIAYEMTQQLAERFLPEPAWLGISSCGAPFEPAADAGPPMYTLPSPQLRDALAAMGGLPPAIVEDDDIWQLYEPRLRADFQVVGGWHPRRAGADRIAVPCSLFGGEDDAVVTPGHLMEWAAGADQLIGQHLFAGAHFYFDGMTDAVVAQIVEEIDTALPGTASW
ncbi:thioesterase II family protein [Streptomyces sp. NPDC054866]